MTASVPPALVVLGVPGVPEIAEGDDIAALTAPLLANALHVYLHIEGDGKRGVLCGAMEDGPDAEMPVRAVLRRAQRKLKVYWSP